MNTQSPFKSLKKREKALACYDVFMQNWPIPYTTQYINTSFGKTYVVISGASNKKPLVLLHGAGTNSIMWIMNIAELAKHFCVYAVDIIGEPGHSAETRPAYHSDQYAIWLNEVLNRLSIQQTALCGVSLGGMFCMQFAAKFPERISALALLAPPSLFPINASFIWRGLAGSILPTQFFAKNFLEYISASAKQLSPEAVQAFILQLKTYKPKLETLPVATNKDLQALPSNTLVMIGEQEVMYDPHTVCIRLHTIAPAIKVEIIPNAKHTIHLDRIELVNQRLIELAASF